jgi:hypothetical protein
MRAVVRGRGAVVGMRTGGRAYCGHCVVKHTTNRYLCSGLGLVVCTCVAMASVCTYVLYGRFLCWCDKK